MIAYSVCFSPSAIVKSVSTPNNNGASDSTYEKKESTVTANGHATAQPVADDLD